MQVFGVQPSVAAPVRVLAATYAHNQLYYEQSDLQTSQRKRWAFMQAAQKHAQKAASGIASVLDAARNLRETAAAMRGSNIYANFGKTKDALTGQDQEDTAGQLRQLLASYNSLLKSLDEAKPYLKRSVKSGIMEAASEYGMFGIRQNSDGTLELDEGIFKERISAQFEPVMNALTGNGGLADKLFKLAEQLDQEPASALLNQRFNLQPPLSSYQYHLLRGNTFQTGLLLDAVV